MNEDMKVARHISQQFDDELAGVRSLVLTMGKMVEVQLDNTLRALSERDVSKVADVSEQDDVINRMEMQIDEECTRIIARRQPTAIDLRMLVASVKCVRDLERIGDEVERAAKMIARTIEIAIQPSYYEKLLLLAEEVKSLLHGTLQSYAFMESRRAAKNIRKDSIIDNEYGKILAQLVPSMKKDDIDISAALDVVWAARSLERVGDHCINICENVIYMVEGQDVRHTTYDDV